MALAAAVMLVLPAAAGADHGAPVLDDDLQTYMATAQDYWGEPRPTCLANGTTLIPVHAVFFDDPNPAVVARADQPGCRLWLDQVLWDESKPVGACTIIVHEWGHLLGHGHSDDPNNVMAETPNRPPPECARLNGSPRGTGADGSRARCRSRGRRLGRTRRPARTACVQAFQRHRLERALARMLTSTR